MGLEVLMKRMMSRLYLMRGNTDAFLSDDGGSKRQPGGILGNRDKLAALGIQGLRDHEAVELVKQKIIHRDQKAKKVVSYKDEPLPEWVGKDLDILKAIEENEEKS